MLIKMSKYKFVGGKNGSDEDWVMEWEVRLPSVDDLTPLSQLVDIAGAGFGIQYFAKTVQDRRGSQPHIANNVLNSPWG